jgi:glycosyltransferase involved in cell wall biosynthesis
MIEPRGSGFVIIAAHNEETVIERCLDSLREAIAAGVRVAVVCNGCTDRTADLARGHSGVAVLELGVASKAAALRAGDTLVNGGARIYLDADVVMTSRAVLDVLAALQDDHALVGRPPVRFDYANAGFLVRRWYAVRERLPSIQGALWGAGCYALSDTGRARFGQFPDLVSDDLFIDSLFARDERLIVATDPVVARTPRAVADLVRILQRSYRTQREVHAAGHGVSAAQRGQLHDIVGLLRRRPGQSGDVLVYVAIVVFSRLRARRAGPAQWERDQSSRDAAQAE